MFYSGLKRFAQISNMNILTFYEVHQGGNLIKILRARGII